MYVAHVSGKGVSVSGLNVFSLVLAEASRELFWWESGKWYRGFITC